MQENKNNQGSSSGAGAPVSTGHRTAALVLGIVGLVISIIGLWIPFIPIIALTMGIVGVVLAVSSGKKGVPASGGLILSILTIVLSGIGVLCWVACASAFA